jgi:predicted metal-dependent hydrolase
VSPAPAPSAPPAAAAPTYAIDAGGRTLPLVIRRHPRAARIVLRLAPGADRLLLTLPTGASIADGLRLAEAHRDWIADRLARLPAPVPFALGAVIPWRGAPHVVRPDPGRRRRVAVTDGALLVGGDPARLAATLGRWLRADALADLEARSRSLAARLGRPVGRVRVKELRSRWGSCARSGDLSYAWRLILAPDAVRQYVAAHEVAHLARPGHDARFWAEVAALVPGDDVAAARRWLRRHGPGLFRYG